MSDLKAKSTNYFAKPAKLRNDMTSVLKTSSKNTGSMRPGSNDNKRIPSLINGRCVDYKQ